MLTASVFLGAALHDNFKDDKAATLRLALHLHTWKLQSVIKGEAEMIVVTGATGRTGRRVTELLLAKGEQVRAIGRDANKLGALVHLGAEPSIANVADVNSTAKCLCSWLCKPTMGPVFSEC
jgi:NADPH:quinone reductase-like Zn-dependent oxidoreductase